MRKSSILLLYQTDYDFFLSNFYDQRRPAVLRGFDIGPCAVKWNKDYLAEAGGDQEVKVHVSSSPLMSFLGKNFVYRTLPFRELAKRAAETEHEDFFLSPTEYYYLRSLGSNPRRDKADIRDQFPTLEADIRFPKEVRDVFSSVFRVSSAGLSLWTHYDVMDNFLIQVHGRKKAVLFPPDDALKLYLNGDKSEVIDIENPDFSKFPEFKNVDWHEFILEPGDILYIPALWFHNMKALDFSVAVNVFWKSLDNNLYDNKDPYGNKDLLPAQRAFTFMDKAIASIDNLPSPYRRFYFLRLMSKIQSVPNLCKTE